MSGLELAARHRNRNAPEQKQTSRVLTQIAGVIANYKSQQQVISTHIQREVSLSLPLITRFTSGSFESTVRAAAFPAYVPPVPCNQVINLLMQLCRRPRDTWLISLAFSLCLPALFTLSVCTAVGTRAQINIRQRADAES